MTSPDSASPQPCLRERRDSVLENAKEVLSRLETIQYLVASELRAGHRNKVLGNLWTLLDPLLLLGVYFLVFGLGLRQAGDNPGEFVIYLSIGLIAFHALTGRFPYPITGSVRDVMDNIVRTRAERPSKLRPDGDVANLVVFLASTQARYITGTTIQVDGGSTTAVF